MKTYGIYLCYPPNVDLTTEGLGRQLIEFLKEAGARSDTKFVISCPSWMRKSLLQVLETAAIDWKVFEIIGPTEVPALLRLYDWYQGYATKRSRLKGLFYRLKVLFGGARGRWIARAERTLATTRNAAVLATLILAGSLVAIVGIIVRSPVSLLSSSGTFVGLRHSLQGTRARILRVASIITTRPQDNSIILRFYRLMEEWEAERMCASINQRNDISAWYAPTAFWPHFNKIAAPKLMCVPDVVLTEFPVGFSVSNGDRGFESFKLVEKSIKGGHHFVTYSHEAKNRTLIGRYGLLARAITVIPHGANKLDELIRVSGFSDPAKATEAFCRNLFSQAVLKAVGTNNANRFGSGEVKFIFYASQFRPNKNVLSLLRAYENLLRKRFVGHKLILTGNPNGSPEIANFIRERNLQNDVLCLRSLSDQELAACYRLADLAVNPSLSEGGCPFTLTEALSVGTPVVMSRIRVSEEVVTDRGLQSLMFFDPYSWEDIANKMEWALTNRTVLLSHQLPLYERLAERSWSSVVDEYIVLLDQISVNQPARLLQTLTR